MLNDIADAASGRAGSASDTGEADPVVTETLPDIAFTLSDGGPLGDEPEQSVARDYPTSTESDAVHPEQAPNAEEPDDHVDIAGATSVLARRLMESFLLEAPTGWRRLEAVFSVAATVSIAEAGFFDGDGHLSRVDATPETLEYVHELRALTSVVAGRPWWRIVLWLSDSGELDYEFDYGDRPFPADHLLPPEAYEADLTVYPRDGLPVWLAAYMRHNDRQLRTPERTQDRVRADRAAGITPDLLRFPSLDLVWARWAVVAAAAVATGSDWGPRIFPSAGRFESVGGSGSTLQLLPGRRAVLSGGIWDDPSLDAAYNAGAPLPDYFAGAPDWLAVPVLNPRVGGGLLSFCYWWDGDGWYRGESPDPDRIGDAIPGLWTVETVVDVVCRVMDESVPATAVADLVRAAESAEVDRDIAGAALRPTEESTFADAYHQLALAGVTVRDR
ncbi:MULTISPECIES: hypothetical protein [unclassified Nocardia]|uniref:hypothetical protein n=1 Tax=unclassified Nocardia TaxID=2637762 RepID=UPI001CE47AE5|nr:MULTISPECIES: hypothetical protein [unclassified Nocardia]